MDKHNNIKKVNIKFNSSLIPLAVIALVALSAGAYSYLKGNSSDSVLGSKSKNTKSKKEDKSKPNIEKSNNGKKYRENVTEAITILEEVIEEEEQAGNAETSNELEKVVEEEGEGVEETAEVIDELESRDKWKNLVSPDYKNLGQLRSALVRNTNSIRKITRAMNKNQGISSGSQAQEPAQLLNQERERIMEIIQENEEQFNLLGWVVKLLTGYEETNEEVEENTTVESGTEPEDTIIPGTGL